MNSKSKVREATFEAVVIRADGTRENLGVVAYYHRNPIKRLAWSLNKRLKTWHQS